MQIIHQLLKIQHELKLMRVIFAQPGIFPTESQTPSMQSLAFRTSKLVSRGAAVAVNAGHLTGCARSLACFLCAILVRAGAKSTHRHFADGVELIQELGRGRQGRIVVRR
jgi:hypothetical protein